MCARRTRATNPPAGDAISGEQRRRAYIAAPIVAASLVSGVVDGKSVACLAQPHLDAVGRVVTVIAAAPPSCDVAGGEMGTHAIAKVVPVHDAVDRLEWQVRLALSGFGSKLQGGYVLRCDGRFAFYRERVSGFGPAIPQISLAARWMSTDRPQLWIPEETSFGFATDLPGDALDRIERFRDGGPLYARFEGRVALVLEKSEGGPDWIGGLVQVLGDRVRSSIVDVSTDHFALREQWCGEILSLLRPPGRHLVEIHVPTGRADGAHAQRALDHLREAQRAFDDARFPDVLRAAYVVLDELNHLNDGNPPRYGTYRRDRLREQMRETRALCNPDRHGSKDHLDSAPPDRVLAQHILAVTASACGVVLR